MNPQKRLRINNINNRKKQPWDYIWMVIILIGHKSEKDPLKICYFHPCIIYFLGKNIDRLCINAE